MQYLVETSLAPEADPEVVANGLRAEQNRVRELYADQTVRHIWNRADRRGAVLLIEAPDGETVVSLMRSLPLVERGAVLVDAVIPLMPYAGFARC